MEHRDISPGELGMGFMKKVRPDGENKNWAGLEEREKHPRAEGEYVQNKNQGTFQKFKAF